MYIYYIYTDVASAAARSVMHAVEMLVMVMVVLQLLQQQQLLLLLLFV